VALDLVGAAVDRDLAPVEVGGGEGARVVRSDRRLVAAVEIGLVGHRIRPDHVHEELGDRLLDLRALDLEDRGRPGRLFRAPAPPRRAFTPTAWSPPPTAAISPRKCPSSIILAPPPAGSSAASSLSRRRRSLETPTRAIPVRSWPSRYLA